MNIFTEAFDSPADCLTFYRKTMPGRCPDDGLEDEIGPVFQQTRADLAEQYRKRNFCIGDTCVDMRGGFDWKAAPNGDLEWTCTLARHHHILALARAYRKSADETFAEAAIIQLFDWIQNVTKPDLPEEAFDKFLGDDYLIIKRSNWRPLETAFRIGETWPLALQYLAASPAMTPEIWAAIMASIHAQAEYLSKHRWRIGNHAVMEASMLAICAIIFRELRDAAGWRRAAIAFLEDYLPEMFFDDGYSTELSGGYNWVAKKGYVALIETAVRNGCVKDIFAPAVISRLFKVFKSELYHLKPDFTVPATNDSNYAMSRFRQLRRINNILHDDEIEYFLSRGKSGTKPLHDSYCYPDAGLVIMRSGWEADSQYLFFDAGRKGGHVVGDQLSVEVSAYGVPVLANAGRWRYATSDKELDWMEWAAYFKTSASCNTVIPSGCTQIPADVEFGGSILGADHDCAVGAFKNGYMRQDGVKLELSHTRQVCFAKPDFWVIRDTVTGAAPGVIEQHWHFLPGFAVEKHPGYIRAQGVGMSLFIVHARPAEVALLNGSEHPKGGWMCPEYAVKLPASEAVFSMYKDAQNCVFETLIFPCRGNVSAPPQFDCAAGEYKVCWDGQIRVLPAYPGNKAAGRDIMFN